MSTNTTPASRRTFLMGAAGAAAGAVLAKNARGAEERPNFLWITTEDMSCNLGCYGDKYANTPNLDRFAQEAIRYTKAFATAPVCSPVRSCLITGCLATTMGTPNLRSDFPVPDFITGFPSYFRKAGYYCTNNVKTDYNTSREPAIIKASWNQCSNTAHWRDRPAGTPFFAIFNNMVTHQSRTMVYTYEEFQKNVQPQLGETPRHDPDTAPVWPYYPDSPIVRRTVARYYDCISIMDKDTGRLLRELEEDGLADDTIVFFYSDHGAGMPRRKRLIYDSGLHAPLMVRIPKKYQHLAKQAPGTVSDRLISFVDLPATVLSMAGLTIPDYMQGVPFLGPEDGPPRSHIYGARDRVDEAYDLARCVRDDNWMYMRTYMPQVSYNQPSWYSDQGEIRRDITQRAARGELTTDAQKQYAGPTRPIEELYDTKNDPDQIHNLAGDPAQAQRLAAMRKLVREWILRDRDLGFLPETDMERRMGSRTPYEMRMDREVYPLERILAAAELVGTGPGAKDEQIALLKDTDPAIRYWAAMGLRALGDDSEAVRVALRPMLEDSEPAVRAEAAWALAGMGGEDEALDVLIKDVQNKDFRAALRAARALEMLGDKAAPAYPVMDKVLASVENVQGDGAMFIQFALDAARQRREG